MAHITNYMCGSKAEGIRNDYIQIIERYGVDFFIKFATPELYTYY